MIGSDEHDAGEEGSGMKTLGAPEAALLSEHCWTPMIHGAERMYPTAKKIGVVQCGNGEFVSLIRKAYPTAAIVTCDWDTAHVEETYRLFPDVTAIQAHPAMLPEEFSRCDLIFAANVAELLNDWELEDFIAKAMELIYVRGLLFVAARHPDLLMGQGIELSLTTAEMESGKDNGNAKFYLRSAECLESLLEHNLGYLSQFETSFPDDTGAFIYFTLQLD